MSKEIHLTGGHVAIVDDVDFAFLSQYRWRFSHGYAYASIDRKSISMHRLLMKPPADMQVDHINHERADNRRMNLRVCTKAQNLRNRPVGSPSRRRSKYKGVYPRGGSWRTHIGVAGKCVYLGAYRLEEEAAIAYDIAALKFNGEFACTNFPVSISTSAPTRLTRKQSGCGFVGVERNGKLWRAAPRMYGARMPIDNFESPQAAAAACIIVSLECDTCMRNDSGDLLSLIRYATARDAGILLALAESRISQLRETVNGVHATLSGVGQYPLL